MGFTVAISGASGKTGFRIAEEVQRRGTQPVCCSGLNPRFPSHSMALTSAVLTLVILLLWMQRCGALMLW